MLKFLKSDPASTGRSSNSCRDDDLPRAKDCIRKSLLSKEDLQQARSSGAELTGKWITYGSIMYKFYGEIIYSEKRNESSATSANIVTKRRMVAFDLDSTIIATRSGATFAKDANDWKFWDATVIPKLQQLAAGDVNLYKL